MITLYGIPNCDTVKKARAWLTEQGIEYAFHDFKKHGLQADRLAIWSRVLGWDKLLNRQGTSWRKLGPQAQAGAITADGAEALMLANPSLVRRPVVEWLEGDVHITVGFDAKHWLARGVKRLEI